MDSNKSIDGLKLRRSTKAASSEPSSKKSIPKVAKSTKNHSHANVADHHVTSTKPKKVPKTTPTPKSAKSTTAQSTAKPSSIDINEDFLSPSQIFDFDDASGELKAADITSSPDPQDPSSSKKHKKGKKQKKPMSKKRKIILWIVSIFILLIIGAVVWFILWGNSIIAKITDGQGNILDLITETYAPLKTDANGRTNILAFGTSGYNMNGDEGDSVHDGAQLTDSIMVISLDQETGDTAMLSIPRDLKASPTCTATGKINEVYWCNNMEGTTEQAGAEALITEVSDILDIEIQYYAHVNWGSLVQIVDTLGGITVTVDEDIDDYYKYEAGGNYTMGGEEALWLARIRHGTAHGDFTRTASQQKILIAIKNRIFEKSLSITDLLSLASTLGDNLRTNFSIDEMKTLAHLSSSFDFDTMRQVSLIDPVMLVTTGTINGISYVLPAAGANNYLAIQNYVAKMFSSDPRSYENYTILVLNATDTPGLASSEQITLKDSGYDNIYIDDAPEGTYAEGYTLYNLTDAAPGTRKLLEEKYGAALPLESLPANISTDYDFILIVNPADTDSNN